MKVRNKKKIMNIINTQYGKKKGREGERKREVGRGKQVEYGICVNSCSCSSNSSSSRDNTDGDDLIRL